LKFFVRSSASEKAERVRFRDAIVATVSAARRGIAVVGEGDAEDATVIAAHDRWRQKYGDEEWSPIPADDVYELLEEIVQPREFGLERVRRGSFAGQVDADIIRVLRVAPYKGYSYGLEWGVSLAFVPHEFERRVRFHRTLKSAALDLFEDAVEELGRRGGDERDGSIPAGYGAEVFRRDATQLWRLVRPRVEEWWGSTTTVARVLARARAQKTAQPVPRHWPEPALVEAFALARLGRDEEARLALESWLRARARASWPPTAVDNLSRALEQVRPSAE
jgi:hypothetical protein